MTNYATHFSTRSTPQSEQADKRQVANSAGGFSFQIDKWQQLERWLILGSDGGSYYATEKKLTVDNAKAVIACLDEDGARAVELIAKISEAGRAPKNDPAIFALAIAAGHKDDVTRAAALAALPRVCRIGTHLFHFAQAVEQFRGWGRGLRNAIARWYGSRTADQVAYQVAKYGQRDGWSHRDLMRLSHPKPEHAAVYRYVVSGAAGMGDREVIGKGGKGEPRRYAGVGELPAFLAAFEELKATTNAADACRLIRAHNFTHEMVPSTLKDSVDLWEALLERMPMTAMIRNLAKMTAVGLLKPMSAAERTIAGRLNDVSRLREARVHPLSLLSALAVYQQGHGEKGKLTWSPARAVVDALDAAFYKAFDAIEPTGKRTLLALDVSGSMFGGLIAGCPGVTPGVGAAAMAMVTARAEQNWHCVGFSSGVPGEFTHGDGKSMHYGYRSGMTPLAISPRQRLDDVVATMRAVPMGGTDCALPMLYAAHTGLEVDTFVVYTDSETWHGSIHPHQALVQYRQKTGVNAKLAVVGMIANEFSIANPTDPGEMDFIGFDTSAPQILADFSRGPLAGTAHV